MKNTQAVEKLLVLLSLLAVSLLVGCQTAAPRHAEKNVRTIAPVDEILALFEQYWNLGEDAETGNEFMRRFKEGPALVLKALAATTPAYREQMLILIGSTIASARHNDPIAYSEYTKALELTAGLDLDDDSARMLGFVHGNIEYWYNH